MSINFFTLLHSNIEHFALQISHIYLQISIICDYEVYEVLVISLQGVGTPTSATVCDGRTTTLECDRSQSNGAVPLWRVFTTSDTSGSPVVTLASGENSPPYNYPTVQAGDTVARLEVTVSSSIDGYHFQCRLSLTPPVDSPGTGTITVTGMHVHAVFVSYSTVLNIVIREYKINVNLCPYITNVHVCILNEEPLLKCG